MMPSPRVSCWIAAAGLIAALMLAACVPPAARMPETVEPTSDEGLYATAQQAYMKGALHTAQNYYQVLIQNFPDSPRVPQALLNLGRIQILLKDDDAALESFAQLLETHPQTDAAGEAGVEMMAVLYRLERYQEMLTRYPDLVAPVEDPRQLYRLYLIVADAHAALQSWSESFYFYALAYPLAADADQATLADKMANAASFLQDDEIELLMGQITESPAAGYLFFQLALNKAGEGAYDDAVWLLIAFQERFGRHPNAALAEELVAQLADKIAFDRYTIGCLLPLSGPYQPFGERALDGIQLAFHDLQQIQAGLPVRLIVRDTASDPQEAAAAMDALAEARVAGVIGPIASAESAAEVAQASRIPIMVLSQREGLTDIGDYVFRYFITSRMQANALAAFATQTLKYQRFAILYPEEKYGRDFRDLFWDAVYREGGQVVALESYDPQQTDFAAAIKKLVGSHFKLPEDMKPMRQGMDLLGPLEAIPGYTPPDPEEEAPETVRTRRKKDPEADELKPVVDFEAVFIPDAPKMLGLVVPQLAYHDVVNTTLLGTNLWFSTKLLDAAGEYVQGAILTTGFFPESQDPTVRSFVLRFEAIYGRQPGFIEAIAYDAARVMLTTVLHPDAWLRAGIRHRLLGLETEDGVTGAMRFEGNGDSLQALPLLQVQGNGFQQLNPSAPPVWRPWQVDVPPVPERKFFN
ncbi:MAG: penicillin-binding protein activator [Desulfobacterales bacterium]|nr:penicillin-binding protein activator [Desulfobacterales bacterium]